MSAFFKNFVFGFFFAFFILTSCAQSESITTPTTSKTPTKDVPFEIEFEKWTLPNGLNVIFHIDKTTPVVHFNLWYHVGSKNDPDNIHGFAHLFEHMMYQGSKNLPGDYFNHLSQIGASQSNASTNLDRTDYYTTIPSENLEKLLWMESDRMGFMVDALDEKQFANQKDVVVNEKKQRESGPYSQTSHLIAKNLYPVNHPYSSLTIGDMDQLNKSTLKDVREFYSQYYSPNNATLTLAGNFNPEQAKAWIEKYFGNLKPGKSFKRFKKWIPSLEHNRKVVIEKDVPLPVVYIAWPSPHRYHNEEIPLDFATSILAGDTTSRLYKILVHEKQIASEVLSSNPASEITGQLFIAVVLRPGHSIQEAIEIINAEVQNFAKNGPTENEVLKVKSAYEYGFLTKLESLEGKAELLNQLNTFLGNPSDYKKFYSHFLNTSAEDIRLAFKKWVADAHSLEIQFVPQKPQAENTKIDRTLAPKPSEKMSLDFPKIESTTLENGLDIHVVKKQTFPKVLITLGIKTGNLLETKEKSGTSFLTASAIERGTKEDSYIELAEKFSLLGANFSSSGNKYDWDLSLNTLKKHLDKTFDLFAHAILNPAFDDEEIDRMKKLYSDDLDYEMSQPDKIAGKLANSLIFDSSHPTSLSYRGTKESLLNITRDDVVKEYQTFFVPNNAYLLFVGDITLEEAKSLSQKYFANWQAKDLPQFKVPQQNPHNKHKIYVVDFPKQPQTSIVIGMPWPAANTEDRVALKLSNKVLGGGMTGRLFNNLREDKGYTYGAYSGEALMKHSGVFSAFANVKADKTYESLLEFKKEIEGLKNKNKPSSSELEVVRKNSTSNQVSVWQTLGGISGLFNSLITNGLPLEEATQTMEKIENTTLKDINAAIAKHYFDNGWTIVLAGDADEIKNELKDVDWADIEYVDKLGNPIVK